MADEADIDAMFTEIERRSLNSSSYPFAVDKGVVSLDQDLPTARLYAYLLLTAFPSTRFRVEKQFAMVERSLDVITVHALRRLLGDGAEAVRFAWPPGKGSDRRPARFTEAVKWLAAKLNLKARDEEINPNRRDGGVDVVAWRPFRDGRSAFPVVLAQTTIQANFAPKAKDVSASKWRDWIAFGNNPSTAIVIPYVVPMGDHRWNDMKSDTNIVIDRLRLCELIEGTGAESDCDLSHLPDWVEEQLNLMALP